MTSKNRSSVADSALSLHGDSSHAETYRGFVISFYAPPIPVRAFDWQWVHEDYDGPEDNRCGHAPSREACRAEIDFWHEEHSA